MNHTIRLRGFWDVAEVDGGAVHARNFGKPRLPDERERVWLVCCQLPAPSEIRLNGELVERVDQAGSFASDITTLLRERNLISLTVPAGQTPGEVVLEIHPPPS